MSGARLLSPRACASSTPSSPTPSSGGTSRRSGNSTTSEAPVEMFPMARDVSVDQFVGGNDRDCVNTKYRRISAASLPLTPRPLHLPVHLGRLGPNQLLRAY